MARPFCVHVDHRRLSGNNQSMSKKKNLIKQAKETLERAAAEKLEKQAEFLKLRGKIRWEGDLDEMRTDSRELQDWYDFQYKQ